MKHKVKVNVETKKRGLFGSRTVMEQKTIEVDDRTYRKMQREERRRPLTAKDLMLYELIFEDDD